MRADPVLFHSPLLELANYHILGRIFYYVPYFAPLPPGRVLSTFGALMALIEALNSLGVAFSSNASGSPSKQQLGSRLTIAALVLQLGAIIIFVILAVIFQWRCTKANMYTRAVSKPLVTMYISMSLILVRCIYRLVEHLGNTTVKLDDPDTLMMLSPALRYEWFFYVFDATLMLLNSVLWNLRHPRRYLPANPNIYLAQDGKTELEGKVQTSGSITQMLLSLLTFGMFSSQKPKSQLFWELNSYSGPDRQA